MRVCKQWHSALAFLRLDNMHLKETCLNSYLYGIFIAFILIHRFLQKFGTVPAISVNLDFFPFFAHFCPEDAVENTERLTLIFDQSSEVKGAWKGREKRPVNRNGRRNQEENNGEFLMRMLVFGSLTGLTLSLEFLPSLSRRKWLEWIGFLPQIH